MAIFLALFGWAAEDYSEGDSAIPQRLSIRYISADEREAIHYELKDQWLYRSHYFRVDNQPDHSRSGIWTVPSMEAWQGFTKGLMALDPCHWQPAYLRLNRLSATYIAIEIQYPHCEIKSYRYNAHFPHESQLFQLLNDYLEITFPPEREQG